MEMGRASVRRINFRTSALGSGALKLSVKGRALKPQGTTHKRPAEILTLPLAKGR